MDAEILIALAGTALASGSLLQAAWSWLRSRRARRITVRVNGEVLELDADNPEDAERILKLVQTRDSRPEVLVDKRTAES